MSRTAHPVLSVKNKYDFQSLAGMNLQYGLVIDGYAQKTKQVALGDVKAGDSVRIDLGISKSAVKKARKQGKEVMLNVYVTLDEAATWAPAGHIVAQRQFALADRAPLPAVSTKGEKLAVSRTADAVSVTGDGLAATLRRPDRPDDRPDSRRTRRPCSGAELCLS